MTDSAAAITVDSWANTVMAWVLVVLLIFIEVNRLLAGDVLWTVLAAAVLTVALLPNAVKRRKAFLLPWELLFLAALPFIGRVLDTALLSNQVTTVFAVAAFALLVVVELHLATDLQVTTGFAILLTVVATLASAGAWSIVLWLSDVYRGTMYIPSNDVLMQGFLATTGIGVFAGVLFTYYFRRHHRIKTRVRSWFQ